MKRDHSNERNAALKYVSFVDPLALSLVFMGTCAASAQEYSLIEPVLKMGISAAEDRLGNQGNTPLPPTPEKFQSAAAAAIERHNKLRSNYTAAQTGMDSFVSISDALLGASISSVSPMAIVGALVLRGAVGYGNVELERQMRNATTAELEKVRIGIEEIGGEIDIYELGRTDPQALSRLLVEQEQLIPDIHRLARESNDPALLATIAEAMSQQAYDMARGTAELSLDNLGQIETTRTDLATYVQTTRAAFAQVETSLTEHAQRLLGLENEVASLSDSVATLDTRVNNLGQNQDLIADLLFSRSTPQERIVALRGGLLDNRIACPITAADCDTESIKTALITRFENEVRVTTAIASVGSLIEDSGTALKIAGDLGINIPSEIGQGMMIAQAAFTAATTFTTNPLGAIAALTGLFGSKQDAAAERHAQLMNYLGENFQRINEQFIAVQENQQKIMEGIINVSEQVREMHIDLDSRFNALQEHVLVIDQNVRQILWRDWQNCQEVLQYAMRTPGSNTGSIDKATLMFPTFDARSLVIRNRRPQVERCIEIAQRTASAIRTPSDWDRFGVLLDLDRNDIRSDPILQGQLDAAARRITGDPQTNYQTINARYRTMMVEPSTKILVEWAEQYAIDPVTLLHLLVQSPSTLDALRAQRERVLPEGNPNLGWRLDCRLEEAAALSEIICRSQERYAMANKMLSAGLATDVFTDAANWVVVISQLADLFLGGDEGFATLPENLATASEIDSGYEIISTFVSIGNMVVAYEQRLSGALTAMAIAESVLAKKPLESAHHLILGANPYLAENVALILLTHWRDEVIPNWESERISFTDRYTQAILYSRGNNTHPQTILEALFGTNRGFTLGTDGRARIELQTENGSVQLPLPGPVQLAEGRFVMPARHTQTLIARDTVLNRLIDYELARSNFTPSLLAAAALP